MGEDIPKKEQNPKEEERAKDDNKVGFGHDSQCDDLKHPEEKQEKDLKSEPPAKCFSFPVMLPCGTELHMKWMDGDDLHEIGTQFAREHGLPQESLPQLVEHAERLAALVSPNHTPVAKAPQEASAEASVPKDEQVQQIPMQLLRDMGIHADEETLQALLTCCDGDMNKLVEMLIHQQ